MAVVVGGSGHAALIRCSCAGGGAAHNVLPPITYSSGTLGFEPLTLHRLDMNTTGVRRGGWKALRRFLVKTSCNSTALHVVRFAKTWDIQPFCPDPPHTGGAVCQEAGHRGWCARTVQVCVEGWRGLPCVQELQHW